MKETKAMNVGIVGCGMIARQYLGVLGQTRWLSPVACADLVPERAEAACSTLEEKEWGKARPASLEEILADDDIDLVLNLTNPKGHYPITLQALEAGKHVHSEKPLAMTREEGRQLLAAAESNGVRLGCAPDTFLGCGHQTARAVIDSGRIGEPSMVTLFMLGSGPDGYGENPEVFFQAGAGPLMDVGVYYLTDAVQLLGSIQRVTASAKSTFPERLMRSGKLAGTKIKVEAPTHVTAALEFESGILGTLIASFDILGGHHLAPVEVHGTEGSLSVPDPNGFGGNGAFKAARSSEPWEAIEPTHGTSGMARGTGAADLAAAVANGRPHRASGELAYHVLDVALAIHESAGSGSAVDVESTVERPSPFAEGIVEDIED